MEMALTIAGFDPSGGAGIQEDLKVFRALGLYGISVVSSLTAQNSRGVEDVIPVASNFFGRQLEVLISDMRPKATKTGMLYTRANVVAVAEMIRKYSLKNVVIDPVMLSSSGKDLVERGLPATLIRTLLPLCAVVTPNIYEASALSGIRIKSPRDMEAAAVRLSELGAGSVIITGGHLERSAMDLVYDGRFHNLKGRKLAGEYHGTGCTFSAAITSSLAKGESIPKAAEIAKKFMSKAFRKTFSPGKGMKFFNI